MKRLVMTRATNSTTPVAIAADVFADLPAAEWPALATAEVLVEQLVREAIDAGLTLHETSERIVQALSASGACFSHDELRTWIRAHALSLT